VLGKLDQKLYANAEADNTKAATGWRPTWVSSHALSGTRINQATTALSANGVSGVASYYEVKFSDATSRTARSGREWSVPSGADVPQGAAKPALVVCGWAPRTIRWT